MQPTVINKKILSGIVVSDKMSKTIVVNVETRSKHKLYHKLVITHKKYHAHDEKEVCKIGDKVKIVETRPLSKTKRWRLYKIVEKAK
ncbi:MAG: 30S ribosomal protein S17 [Mycoplasmoidaceae bacterium]